MKTLRHVRMEPLIWVRVRLWRAIYELRWGNDTCATPATSRCSSCSAATYTPGTTGSGRPELLVLWATSFSGSALPDCPRGPVLSRVEMQV